MDKEDIEEAMQMALEALESDPTSLAWLINKKQAITGLRQALVDADDKSQERVDEKAKREQEPIAWMHTTGTGHVYFRKKPQDKVFNPQPVFTTPSKKEWVGLTDEEIQNLSYLSQKIDEGNAAWFDRFGFARAIETRLQEKNQ
jgi:hypothetical protein